MHLSEIFSYPKMLQRGTNCWHQRFYVCIQTFISITVEYFNDVIVTTVMWTWTRGSCIAERVRACRLGVRA